MPDTQDVSIASPETCARVLNWLVDRQREGRVEAPVREVANDLRIGRNTAHRALLGLKQWGLITVLRPGTGDGYPAQYEVNVEVAA